MCQSCGKEADGPSPAKQNLSLCWAYMPGGTRSYYFDLVFKIDKLCVVATFQRGEKTHDLQPTMLY